MSRRARQRQHHHRAADPMAAFRAIRRTAYIDADDVDRQIAIVAIAVEQFIDGQHCAPHWISLADTLNVAETMAGMGLGSDVRSAYMLAMVQRALYAVHCRHQQHGSWQLSAEEIDSLLWLAPLHRAQLEACKYHELEWALSATENRRSQARAGAVLSGAIVIEGQIHSRAAVSTTSTDEAQA